MKKNTFSKISVVCFLSLFTSIAGAVGVTIKNANTVKNNKYDNDQLYLSKTVGIQIWEGACMGGMSSKKILNGEILYGYTFTVEPSTDQACATLTYHADIRPNFPLEKGKCYEVQYTASDYAVTTGYPHNLEGGLVEVKC